MEYIIKDFNDLKLEELYNILALRNEVFVVEQDCPYQDVDGKDLNSYHVLGYVKNELAAYCRIVRPGISYEEASIGRVIVKDKFRHLKLGSDLMTTAINKSNELGYTKLRISAQAHLVKFYGGVGFKTVGEIYLEDDIEHIEMFRG